MFVISNKQLEAIDRNYISQQSEIFYEKYNKQLKEKYGSDNDKNLKLLSEQISIFADADIIKLEHWEELIKADLSYSSESIIRASGINVILEDDFKYEKNKVDVIKNFIADLKFEANGK